MSDLVQTLVQIGQLTEAAPGNGVDIVKDKICVLPKQVFKLNQIHQVFFSSSAKKGTKGEWFTFSVYTIDI